MAYESWFNTTRNSAVRGIEIKGSVHKLSPISSKSRKGWKKCDCLRCKSKNAFLFRSHTDGNVYMSFCQKCKKSSQCCEHGNDIATCKECRKSKPLCKGVKADGSLCKFKALPVRKYCGQHSERLNGGFGPLTHEEVANGREY